MVLLVRYSSVWSLTLKRKKSGQPGRDQGNVGPAAPRSWSGMVLLVRWQILRGDLFRPFNQQLGHLGHLPNVEGASPAFLYLLGFPHFRQFQKEEPQKLNRLGRELEGLQTEATQKNWHEFVCANTPYPMFEQSWKRQTGRRGGAGATGGMFKEDGRVVGRKVERETQEETKKKEGGIYNERQEAAGGHYQMCILEKQGPRLRLLHPSLGNRYT